MESAELSEDLRIRLGRLPVSALTTVLATLGITSAFMTGVRPLAPGQARMVGQAHTLRYIPSRPDVDTIESFSRPDALQRLVLEACPPGAVLVIDARGVTASACAGDSFAQRLQLKGCAGLVTDGGLRDVADIAALDFPVYLQAPAAPPTFLSHHPVDSNVPIACGGVAVYPGDVIVGDQDGVVVIPFELTVAVTEGAEKITAYDQFVDEKLREGRSLVGLYPATEESRAEYMTWQSRSGLPE